MNLLAHCHTYRTPESLVAPFRSADSSAELSDTPTATFIRQAESYFTSRPASAFSDDFGDDAYFVRQLHDLNWKPSRIAAARDPIPEWDDGHCNIGSITQNHVRVIGPKRAGGFGRE